MRTCTETEATATAAADGPRAELPPLALAGLDALLLTREIGFLNVGERCNVAGSRKFLRLIQEQQYEEAIAIARKQVEDGAMVLDINMDDGLLNTRQEMCHFLNLLAAEPDICRVPFMIDSSNWEVISAALRCIQGKAIVNSISLKEGEQQFLDHARELRSFGAAAIVMAFDEEGQATTYERRTAICQRAYQLLVNKVGFPAEDIIFDPNVLAIATGMKEHDTLAADFIHATVWIRSHLPGSHVSGGVSNLSFAFRGNNYLREAMHAVFLYHARQAGMDMAIVNPSAKVTYADIPQAHLEVIEDAILARREDACERLTALAMDLAEQKVQAETSGSTSGQHSPSDAPAEHPSVGSRLITALRRGQSDHLEADLQEALTSYPTPIAIIEGPLMEGMNLVGKLFGEGKMFLPQVIKTARTMKRAVEILQPAIEAQKRNTPGGETADKCGPNRKKAPRILVATVKGDVHDIGKNIVATVMACNGYEVIDLGVMVPAETIVEVALQEQPDVIGLSGLITPSLEEMVHTVHLLSEAGITVPVLIGGATTSRLHTALKIAPVYAGPVIHVRDASQNAPLAAPFLDPATAEEATRTLQADQNQLRQQARKNEDEQHASFKEAQSNKPHYF
ncbi:MAG: dihydropteroate synthase [Bacteroidaceae bacterium]|nr:dihydropteroate synthase [Bacteroidaceae bacterium]